MIKIGIADDHKVFLTSLGVLLGSQEDFEVIIQATSGSELLDRINVGNMPDIILLDIEMDGLDGLETIPLIREKHGDDIKILILSMHQEPRIVEDVIERGANGFVSKTIEASELIQVIRKVIETGFYLDMATTRDLLKKRYHKGDPDGQITLNEKEIEILKCICKEMSTRQIAEETGLTINTVNSYRKALIAKTDSNNVVGLVFFAIENGYYIR